MPTTPMRRVRTVITGVAGAPYYINGYFANNVGTTNQVISTWHAFVVRGVASFPAQCQITTEGVVPLIDPASGDIVGIENGTEISVPGTSTGTFLPRFTQMLIRWRSGVYVNGREVRGHTNLPFIGVSEQNTFGEPSSELQSAQTVRATALVNNPLAELVIWSKKNGEWQPATSASMAPFFSVLRSRRD